MSATELSGEARVRRSPMERDALLFVSGQRFEDRLRDTKMLSWSTMSAGRQGANSLAISILCLAKLG